MAALVNNAGVPVSKAGILAYSDEDIHRKSGDEFSSSAIQKSA
ncbi:hypothetical protein [Streptomyces sp. SID13726]|nr:hypothetical protein [Streptomyces sp. SID13726]